MSKKLTAGKLLATNTVWNLIGEGAPLLIALVAIPQLVQALGTARFGILMLIWGLIGYMSFFDLGVGRALTNLVAQKLGSGEEHSLPPLIWTANLLMLGVGVVGSLILAGLSHWLVYTVLKIPDALKREALISLYILSFTLPAVISTTGFRGILEAYQRFDAANAIRIPMGVLSFAGPLAVLPYSHSMVPVVAVLAAGRYLALFAYIVLCLRLLPITRSAPHWHSQVILPLLSFGGWMTVSNVVGPLMVGMDRFFLGALVSMQAVTFYATPYEIVAKLLIVPFAIAGVLFPAFSASLASDPSRTRRLYGYATRLIALVMGLLMVVSILCAHFGLRIWLGESFATNSTVVLQVLAAGVFFNSVAQAPFALIQGAGHADWTGKLHLAELPLYLAIFWVLTSHFGITGTAIAYLIRSIADWAVLAWMAKRVTITSSQSAIVGKMAP